MKILVVTNMYPTEDRPAFGVFVKDQVESLRNQGLDVDVLLVDGTKSRLNYLTGYFRLWNQLRKRKYDLIHAHYIYAGMVARGQWKCPVVITHHGIETFISEGSFLESRQPALCRWMTPKFDEVIVVSEEMRSKLAYPQAHVIPCGVDLERFKPHPKEQAREALGLPQDHKLILWAGNPLRREKRFELVEAATEILKARDPSVELVTAADMPHSAVPMYMNACDVLLLVSDAEGSPMVVKEAMACNLPVVSAPVGDVADVTRNTEGCYLCTQEPNDIADKLELALDFGGRTEGRTALEDLSREVVASRIIKVYENALGNRRRQTDSELQGVASRR